MLQRARNYFKSYEQEAFAGIENLICNALKSADVRCDVDINIYPGNRYCRLVSTTLQIRFHEDPKEAEKHIEIVKKCLDNHKFKYTTKDTSVFNGGKEWWLSLILDQTIDESNKAQQRIQQARYDLSMGLASGSTAYATVAWLVHRHRETAPFRCAVSQCVFMCMFMSFRMWLNHVEERNSSDFIARYVTLGVMVGSFYAYFREYVGLRPSMITYEGTGEGE